MSKSGHVYTPKDTLEYEKLIKQAWLDQTGVLQHAGPIELDMVFMYQRAKSHHLKDGSLTTRAPRYMISVPDIDNLEKAVMDALNKVAFLDDSQVHAKRSYKVWGPRNEVYVEVWGLA